MPFLETLRTSLDSVNFGEQETILFRNLFGIDKAYLVWEGNPDAFIHRVQLLQEVHQGLMFNFKMFLKELSSKGLDDMLFRLSSLDRYLASLLPKVKGQPLSSQEFYFGRFLNKEFIEVDLLNPGFELLCKNNIRLALTSSDFKVQMMSKFDLFFLQGADFYWSQVLSDYADTSIFLLKHSLDGLPAKVVYEDYSRLVLFPYMISQEELLELISVAMDYEVRVSTFVLRKANKLFYKDFYFKEKEKRFYRKEFICHSPSDKLLVIPILEGLVNDV